MFIRLCTFVHAATGHDPCPAIFPPFIKAETARETPRLRLLSQQSPSECLWPSVGVIPCVFLSSLVVVSVLPNEPLKFQFVLFYIFYLFMPFAVGK